MTDREKVKTEAPTFYKEFTSALSPQHLSDINNISDWFNAYLSAGVDKQIQSALSSSMQGKSIKDTMSLENVKRVVTDAYMHIGDDLNPIKQFR